MDKGTDINFSSSGALIIALLASDLAGEIKAEFDQARSAGADVPTATMNVFAKFRAALSSTQEGPVVLIALAVLQVRDRYLQEVIRDAALDLIESGEALAAYRSDDSGQRKATGQILNQFALVLGETAAVA